MESYGRGIPVCADRVVVRPGTSQGVVGIGADARRITEAFPAPGRLSAPLRPNSPARHAACGGTRRAELSEFGNAGYVI